MKRIARTRQMLDVFSRAPLLNPASIPVVIQAGLTAEEQRRRIEQLCGKGPRKEKPVAPEQHLAALIEDRISGLEEMVEMFAKDMKPEQLSDMREEVARLRRTLGGLDDRR